MPVTLLRIVAFFACIIMGVNFCHAQAGTATPDTFVPTGSMSQPRDVLSLITMGDGRVFAVGGTTIPPVLISADIYDPSTGLFTPTAPLIFPSRREFVATRLLNGKILILGGFSFSPIFSSLPAELYDPVAQTFELAGSPIATRNFGGLFGATATLLRDGRVLIVGGQDSQSRVTAELYDPTTGTFVEAGQPHFNHAGNIAVLLQNGKVLIAAGGVNTFIGIPTEATAELYDPVTDMFTLTGDMIIPRLFAAATLLNNGNVLIVGGDNLGIGGGPVLVTELYNPQTGIFTPSAQLHVVRDFGSITLLSDGDVLIAGGQPLQFGRGDGQGAELYDPLQDIFSSVIPMTPHRAHHGATLLANGNVLIAGGVEINDLIGSAQRSASAELFVPVPPVPPVPTVSMPTGLSAIAGDASAYLRWDSPATLVDRYLIDIKANSADAGQIIYTPTTITDLTGTQQNTSLLITKLPNGSAIQNGIKYQFNIVAETGGIVSLPSTTVSVIPNTWDASGHLPPRPLNPILFLPGFTGVATFSGTGTFAQTFDFMVRSLGWRYGGQLYHQDSDSTTQISVDRTGQCIAPPNLTIGQFVVPCNDDGTVLPHSDFVSASFGSSTADYSDRRGLDHQADEVKGFINAVMASQIKSDVSVVGHSDGGLGVRDYITSPDPRDKHVDQLITYGTPHQGADLNKIGGLLVNGIFLFDGARDSAFFCSGPTPLYYPSPVSDMGFLGMLNDPARMLPQNIRYVSIAGVSDPNGRSEDCHSAAWDTLVPRSSADLSQAPPIKAAGTSVSVLLTGHRHAGQGNDFPAILCALDPSCISIGVFSPVDIQVIAPDGKSLSENVAEIPGASYSKIQDTPQHQTTSVLIPFPVGGTYSIIPTPHQGTSPNDTFTITLTQNGIAHMLANNVRIQDIPIGGYQTQINAFPVADAGRDQTLECSGPNGAMVRFDGSLSRDPDGDLLTYEWRDENGAIIGSTQAVSVVVPLGIHSFVLTVKDGRGGFNSARVVVTVRDTTPPILDFDLSPNVLWPPDHRLAPIAASIRVNDTCDTAPIVKLISITSSEPPLMVGSGQTNPDIEGVSFGNDDRLFMLRAERAGNGPGRTYTVTYEARDQSGNSVTQTRTVIVPHNK